MHSFSLFTYAFAALAVSVRSTPINPRQAASWPDPESCTGNCSYVHDPSVIRRSDGTWFRFSTLGNIAMASAPSLTGPWTYNGAMLPDGTSIDVVANQQLWAPDVILKGDTYYAYYSVSLSGLQTSDIGVATSSSADVGTWTDHGSLGIPKSSSYNLIDPNFFQQCDTCQNYFTFGSAWDMIYQTTLNTDWTSWSGETPNQLAYNSSGSTFEEGSFQFWWPVDGTDYYYLFFSSGACCDTPPNLAPVGDEYKIMVCRATEPTGPFTDQVGRNCQTGNGGTLILGSHGSNVYAPGGQGVIVDPETGRIALYYHYVNPNIGYDFDQFLFGFNYLDFSSGWPEVTS